MGLIFVEASVENIQKQKEINMLVDSGASYSMVTKPIWKELELKPQREMEFILADGSRIKRNISECFLKLPFVQAEGHTPVILGEDGDDENLLGAVTLKIFGLILDPLSRVIKPMRAMLV
ncbi:MAG: aspartyl protease [Ignavibacteria bacterium GWB2_35_12]|nr:MAG: aspartyl protease [Ignavibacteria bacterium GWA2_35_8]OGU40389.1 MAG: aspartyl protease [Ignavibacteria bacterium GWB2_35_12]OGU92182.1 MAG: aspartyl protease [Ignavibacteria bacterium RIFOXYA2_FULL_35_10]OGV22525.1 MAG: aspartyl protease [Ignavibacteria bacterium RIFOXYC2_FULL_35_21]